VTAFALLTAVGAQIEIPHQPVPYTLQTFFVLLSGAILGMRNGALSQLLYLALGTVGLPVFSGFGFGLARLLGPTGGYLLAFPLAAFAVGYLVQQNKSFLWSAISMMLGLFIIFSLGTLQLNFIYFHDWSQALTNGFLIFSWWDVLKLFAASSIYTAVRKSKSN
jgi:biotin transport system substrate-specific component